jgi:hypothetical protein
MAAGKLANLERTCFVREVTAQEGLELINIQFFTGSHGLWMV